MTHAAQNIQEPEIEAELASIRAKVSRTGGTIIEADRFALLCPAHMSVPEQFRRIAELAAEEGWSFAFLPDGRVRFGETATPARSLPG